MFDMKAIKTTILAALVGVLPGVVRAQNLSNISAIRDADPLIITGAVGTQNTYHYTSGTNYSSPLSNTIYANLNISVYGFSMPFSLYYSNDNLNFSYPQFSFNLNPSYKNWTGHFGQSSMAMSNYVMSTSFNGVGLEYNDSKRLRAGAFYGRLRKAINDDPTDPLARTPQYKRMAWGGKVGYGSGKNYLDLYFLRAYDCLNSIDDYWQSSLPAQENIVVGVKGVTTPFKWMSLSANFATSVFSNDLKADTIKTHTAFDKVFDARLSTLARFAGDANLNLNFRGFNTSISYKLIQPDYMSLGTSYMSNNYQALSISSSGALFKKLHLSGSFSGQADNLTKKQLYTTKGFVYSAGAATSFGPHININAGYNGYLQTQGDGTVRVNDTTRVKRVMNSFSLSPSCSFDNEVLGHAASISANYTYNRDLNKFATGESDVQTLAIGSSYTLDVKPWEMSFGASFSHQQSMGFNTRYTSDVFSLNTGRSFLAEKNLSVSATVNWVYNHMKYQSKSLSMGCSFSAGYTLKKAHMISASAAFSRYGDVNVNKTRGEIDMTDISCSLNYAYTFTLLQIKSKAHKLEDEKKRQEEENRKIEKALKDKPLSKL